MKLSRGKKIGIGVGSFFVLAAVFGNNNPSQKQELNKSVNMPSQSSEIKVDSRSEVEKIETRTDTQIEVIPFTSSSQNDSSLAIGSKQVYVAGVNGERTITYEVSYINGEEVSRKLKSSTVTKQQIDELVKIGMKKATTRPKSDCDPNYTPCVPNVSYDLNCPDIGFSVTIIGHDKHGFDGNDNDGLGCESY